MKLPMSGLVAVGGSCGKIKKGLVGVVASASLLLGLAVGPAQASDSFLASHSGYAYNYHLENTTSSEISKGDTNAESSRTTATIISSRISSMLLPPRRDKAPATGPQFSSWSGESLADLSPGFGRSGGDAAQGLGFWANGAVSILHDNSYQSRNDGDLYSTNIGLDYKLTDKLLVGVSLGHEYLDLKTMYNYGGMWSNGLSLTPYVGYTITDNLTVDALVGYAHLWNKVSESPQGNSLELNGDFESNRLMAAANVNYRLPSLWSIDPVLTAGYMYSNERSNKYTAKPNNTVMSSKDVKSADAWIGEARAGVRLETGIWSKLTPYVAAYYVYDNSMSPGVRVRDNDAVDFLAGFDAQITDRFKMGLELSDSCFRKYEYNTRIGLNLRYEW